MALQEEFEKQGNWLFRYRGTLPLIVLAIGAILYIRTEIYPETFFLENTIYEFYFETGCLLISLLGFGIRIFTVGYSSTNSSGRNAKQGQVADSLNTTGVYSIVRHPLYLGNLFMWLGPAMLTGQFWFVISFCFFYWVYYERIMFAEEQFLRRKFGDSYLKWAENVPAFIPDLRNYERPNLIFNWMKVIRREKAGFLALFLIFFAFDAVGEIIESKSNYNFIFAYGFAISLIYYIVVKYLRRKTAIFNIER